MTTHRIEPSGRPARIISHDGPVDAPIVAIVQAGGAAEEFKGREIIMCFAADYQSTTGHRLVEVKE
jgi:hypothetical protein